MIDRLTHADKKYWHPSPQVTHWLTEQLPPSARVLDVGAGIYPFPRANVLVDFAEPERVPPGAEIVKCDFVRNGLPFPDKSFDFVYCRHVLEDIYDPFSLMKELERVGKAGYIETPSPIAELCVGVEGVKDRFNKPVSEEIAQWRGYYHHLYIAWTHLGELRLVNKFPFVETLQFTGSFTEPLRYGPNYWNTHYLWKDKIKFKHYQNVVDFNLWTDYGPLLSQACNQCLVSNDEFIAKMPQMVKIPTPGLPSHAA